MICGTSLVVQWLRLHTQNAGDLGAIRGQGTSFPPGHNEGLARTCAQSHRTLGGTFDTEPPKKPLRTSAGKLKQMVWNLIELWLPLVFPALLHAVAEETWSPTIPAHWLQPGARQGRRSWGVAEGALPEGGVYTLAQKVNCTAPDSSRVQL